MSVKKSYDIAVEIESSDDRYAITVKVVEEEHKSCNCTPFINGEGTDIGHQESCNRIRIVGQFTQPEFANWGDPTTTPVSVHLHVFHYNNKRIVMMKLSTGGTNGECECDSGPCKCDWVYIAHKDYEWNNALTKFTEEMLTDADQHLCFRDAPPGCIWS